MFGVSCNAGVVEKNVGVVKRRKAAGGSGGIDGVVPYRDGGTVEAWGVSNDCSAVYK